MCYLRFSCQKNKPIYRILNLHFCLLSFSPDYSIACYPECPMDWKAMKKQSEDDFSLELPQGGNSNLYPHLLKEIWGKTIKTFFRISTCYVLLLTTSLHFIQNVLLTSLQYWRYMGCNVWKGGLKYMATVKFQVKLRKWMLVLPEPSLFVCAVCKKASDREP